MPCGAKSLLTALTCAAALCGAAGARAPRDRTVMAWANSDPASVAQLENASWAGIFDGVQASCGVGTAPGAVTVNRTALDACAPLRRALQRTGGEFHVWVGAVAQETLENETLAEAFVASAVATAQAEGFAGYSLDDESDCAPRSTVRNFTRWAAFVDRLADGLHAHGLQLSAAVQAMFGIQDVPYQPLCSPPQDPVCSQACCKAPHAYRPDPEVTRLMRQSKIDRWLEMDTYYFTTARFLDALDYYTGAVPPAARKLGVALENRGDLSAEGVVARFHAIERSGADWVNVFMLPAHDQWMPWLRRWKTRCRGCPNGGVLSCYEPDVEC